MISQTYVYSGESVETGSEEPGFCILTKLKFLLLKPTFQDCCDDKMEKNMCDTLRFLEEGWDQNGLT